MLFGHARDQELLLRIFQVGELETTASFHVSAALLQSGLIAKVPIAKRQALILHNRHPAIHLIREILEGVNGGRGHAPRRSAPPSAGYVVDALRPLGHRCPLAFRLLHHLAQATEPLSRADLGRRMADAYPQTLNRAIERLVMARVITAHRGAISIAQCVPALFRELLLTLGTILVTRDERLDGSAPKARLSAGSFSQNTDGAPALFGTDVRLRDLMAVAKHGPLYVTELRGLTGVSGQKPEGRDLAPFGRGSLVRCWHDRRGLAIDMDPAFPVALPLRRLLVKLEQTYPLPPLVRMYEMPNRPKLQRWKGDSSALFGGPVATSILASIGVLGWTFEGLCVAAALGYDRVVIKNALKTLEEHGILEGDRPRGPGFNIRLITVARTFAARDELNGLLQAYADAWPDVADRTRWAIEHATPRTKKQFRRRDVRTTDADRASGVQSSGRRRVRDGRQQCLMRYYTLNRKAGRALSSSDLLRADSNLYRSIRANWGPFRAFREEAGLEPVLIGKSRQPNSVLRSECIAEYFALRDRVGFLPNTAELNRLNAWLGERIRIQWGGFAAFCDDLKTYPARRKRSSRTDETAKREMCRQEYRLLMRLLEYPPSSWDLRLHTDGLYKRIKKSWGSFESFCDEIGISPPRRRSAKSAIGHPRVSNRRPLTPRSNE